MNDNSLTRQKLIKEPKATRARVVGSEESQTCRRQSDDALQEGGELYRTLIETSPDPIIMYDLRGELLAANQQASKMYGVASPADLLDEVKTVFDFLDEDGKVYAEASFRRTLAEGLPQRNEYRIKVRGGRILTAEMHSSIVRTASGEPRAFISVVRDMTDRRKAEETLRENEEKYRSVVEKSLIGIAVIDDAFQYEYVNEEFCRMAGYERRDILGKNFTFLLSEESKSFVAERNRRRQQGENVPSEYEFYFVKRNGEKRLGEVRSAVYLDSAGKTKVIIQVIDITERKRAEEEIQESRERLRRSEERYRNILDSMEEAYYEVDLKGNNTFFNASAVRKFGYTRDEMLGMNYRQYVDQDEQQKVFKAYNHVFLTGKAIKGLDWVLRTKDGRKMPVEGSISLVRDAQGLPIGFRGVVRDVTERKRAEESLRESEEKYRGILENMDDVYYEVDLKGTYVFFNEAMVSETGYTREELTGMTFKRLIHPEAHHRVMKVFAQVYQTRQPVRLLEYDVVRKDGRRINVESWVSPFFDQKNRPIGFKGMARDITERKRTEEMSRQSEEKFTKVFMTAPDCIAITRVADGRIMDVNLGFEEITGWERSDVIDRTSHEINFWADRSDRNFMVEELKNGRDVRNREFRFRRKDGSLRDGVYSARSIHVADQQCLILILQDVTDRKRLSEERLRLEERLNRAERMEAIGTLAGGIAHDFNNVLSSMMGYAEMIRYKTTDQKIRPYAEQILKACDRSRDLVKQILTFSRQQKQEKKPVSVVQVVKEALKLLRSSIPSTIDIRQEFDARQDTVLADPTQIHQVLINLCTNAVHAMRDQEGLLEVSIHQREISAADRAYHPDFKEGAYLQLIVRDTGEGIDPAIMDKIFNPFFTTKSIGEGTGLGLSVVYGIVKDSGGVISVESETGRGTAFTIHLPLIVVDERPNGKESLTIPKGKGRILYVDDEEAIAALGHDLLTSLGYDVAVCLGGRDALEAFRANPKQYDLVITDMTMPHVTGATLAREILKIRPETPIILTTGFSEMINEEESKKIGIREYLMKPVSFKDLARCVKKLLDQEETSMEV